MGIELYISYVLGAEDVTKLKPDPEPVLKTLEALNIPASETLVVGNMPVVNPTLLPLYPSGALYRIGSSASG